MSTAIEVFTVVMVLCCISHSFITLMWMKNMAAWQDAQDKAILRLFDDVRKNIERELAAMKER